MLEHNISLTAYSPLAQGKAIANPLLRAIGEKYGKSAAQVALRWMLQLEQVMAIPKTADPRHLRENLEIFDFELSVEEVARIDALAYRGGRLVSDFHGADWD